MCECLVLMRANLVCNHNRPQAGHLHHSAHTWPYLTTLLTIFPTQHTCKNTHTHLATLLTLLTLDHTLTHTLDHCTTHTWPYLPDTSPNAAVCWKLNSIFTTSAAIIQKTKKSKGNLKYGMQQFEQRGPNKFASDQKDGRQVVSHVSAKQASDIKSICVKVNEGCFCFTLMRRRMNLVRMAG